jgi:hypothetical protein
LQPHPVLRHIAQQSTHRAGFFRRAPLKLGQHPAVLVLQPVLVLCHEGFAYRPVHLLHGAHRGP